MTNSDKIRLMQHASDLVNYNPDTGVMTWRPKDVDANGWNEKFVGRECGIIASHGYRVLHVHFEHGRGSKILAHRLAWFICFGELPAGDVDHINQNRSDNRIQNLRDVTRSINCRNSLRSTRNTSGVTGVTWHKLRSKWRARAGIYGRRYSLGLFSELADAEAAVKKFRAENDFTENHGRLPSATARTRST